MRAEPLIPGCVYRVRCAGFTLTVIAAHPCAALCVAIDLIGGNRD